MTPLDLTGNAWLDAAIRAVAILAVLLSIVPLLVYFERRICAWIQDRLGPNRVGPFGLLQPLADILKLLLKESILPDGVDRRMFRLAPFLVFAPAMMAFAVIPVGYGLQVANLGIGIIYLLTVGSLAVYGLAFGGWASNNKYSLLGGLRASAQMISYEIALGLSILPVVMTAESVHLQDIVVDQTDGVLGWFSWNLFRHPIAATVFLVAAFAETNRLPFDLPEAESELVGGYHTEYMGMKFALFFLAEYVGMMTQSALMVTLFLGGWTLPGLAVPAEPSIGFVLVGIAIFFLKFVALLFFFLWTRWTLPRYRYDQLMSLGWKMFIPVALLLISGTAVWMILVHPA